LRDVATLFDEVLDDLQDGSAGGPEAFGAAIVLAAEEPLEKIFDERLEALAFGDAALLLGLRAKIAEQAIDQADGFLFAQLLGGRGGDRLALGEAVERVGGALLDLEELHVQRLIANCGDDFDDARVVVIVV
jgi:hypothetical protein